MRPSDPASPPISPCALLSPSQHRFGLSSLPNRPVLRSHQSSPWFQLLLCFVGGRAAAPCKADTCSWLPTAPSSSHTRRGPTWNNDEVFLRKILTLKNERLMMNVSFLCIEQTCGINCSTARPRLDWWLCCTQHTQSCADTDRLHKHYSCQTTERNLAASGLGCHILCKHDISAGWKIVLRALEMWNKSIQTRFLRQVINCTDPALPGVSGNWIHGRLETEGVVALVAGITYQHFSVLSWLSKTEKESQIFHSRRSKGRWRHASIV